MHIPTTKSIVTAHPAIRPQVTASQYSLIMRICRYRKRQTDGRRRQQIRQIVSTAIEIFIWNMRRAENRDDDDNRYQQVDAELKSVLDPDSREK